MKKFLCNTQCMRTICISLMLGLSAVSMPILATEANTPLNESNTTTSRPAPPKDGEGRPDCPCKKRPFRRFTVAMDSLKKEGLISEDDMQKIYDALMKIPRDSLKDAADKDLAAAEALHKDKVLTEEQFQKISAFLKENGPKRP